MKDDSIDILVLGIGNVLWADEGFGVRAVEALDRDWQLPAEVTLMDGGTQGLYLLPYVKAARHIIVFDAVDYGLEPGALKLVRNADIPSYLGIRKMSLHQSNFQEVLLLAMLGGRYPDEILLIGAQPADISDYGGSLGPAARAALCRALDVAIEQLVAWGAPAQRRVVPLAAADQACLSIDAYERGRPDAASAWRKGDARVANLAFGAERT
jgi:hydrogenase maturation protease